jgi:hypothetical protein
MVDWRIDWITITVPDWHNHDAMTPVLLGELMAGQVNQGRHPSGALGWYGRSCFLGTWDNGRLIHWLVHCVVPALRKLVLHDPETRREVGLALARIMDYNPGNEHESDSQVQRSEL